MSCRTSPPTDPETRGYSSGRGETQVLSPSLLRKPTHDLPSAPEVTRETPEAHLCDDRPSLLPGLLVRVRSPVDLPSRDLGSPAVVTTPAVPSSLCSVPPWSCPPYTSEDPPGVPGPSSSFSLISSTSGRPVTGSLFFCGVLRRYPLSSLVGYRETRAVRHVTGFGGSVHSDGATHGQEGHRTSTSRGGSRWRPKSLVC